MEEQRVNKKHKLNVRAKSPIIMSGKSKMALLCCNVKSVPDVDDLNLVQKVLNLKSILISNYKLQWYFYIT